MKLVLVFVVLSSLAVCDGFKPSDFDTQSPSAWQVGPRMKVPDFTTQISLSPAASEKLISAGETIKGTIYFDGDGTSLPNEHTAPFRDVYLGSYDFELPKAGEIRISNAEISLDAYRRLSDTNYHFTINVTSGRRVFENNVLDGGYTAGRRADLDTKEPIGIRCDLL